ncbi:MAG: hypothetical protein BGO45_05780 [Microbacterium sp. 71-36]|uniref:LmeA family phospholipid-binding protein n=1 Tax=unclassified Microbacterium TaxID=2609290 RepID=UPI00086AC23F|nr:MULTISPECIES: LmeA family phospholipid-binding protein [unclassified Microbacterium]MBN9211484.1 hypothetical protein [Microbacterium sp.]ODT41354.1 MAG: hypothetical protein ABS60_02790 [Microbacterium sp. SCN 71-17]OJV75199.1 MAG: hypothetical protein BGO45_05780 [Microbacterium sp. 71-36]
MAFPRSRRAVFLSLGSVLIVVLAVAAVVEITVRARLDARLESLTAEVPGVHASPADGLALWSLATGHVDIDIALGDAAVANALECRTGKDVEVATSAGGIAVQTDLDLRGRSVPARATFVADSRDGAWVLEAESVDVGGFALPPSAVGRLLGDRAPEWLSTGFRLPAMGGLTVTGVRLASGEAHLLVTAPLDPDGPSSARPLAALSCDPTSLQESR